MPLNPEDDQGGRERRTLPLQQITSIIATALGTMLVTVTGAWAWQNSEPQVPGGLRNVGPAHGPVHEVPGGLRNVGPPADEGAFEPAVDGIVQAAAGVSVTWVLVLLAVTALVAGASGYWLRAARLTLRSSTTGNRRWEGTAMTTTAGELVAQAKQHIRNLTVDELPLSWTPTRSPWWTSANPNRFSSTLEDPPGAILAPRGTLKFWTDPTGRDPT